MAENLIISRDRQHLEPNQSNYQWVQLNVGLVRPAGDALVSARHLFASITPLVAQWRGSGCLHNFFFMRKPPDVRLRFLVSNSEIVVNALTQQIKLLQVQGWIREFFFSDYQPELDRFGGSAAMQCVHHYFNQDTSLWLIYDQLCQQCSTLLPETFLPLVFHDLFNNTLIEPHLVFKAWRILGAFIPISPSTVIPQIQLLSIAAFCKRSTLTIAETDLMYGFAEANQRFAESIGFIDANELTCDFCSVLAAIAMFNFNRYGFGGDRSGPLVAAAIQALTETRAAH